MIIINEKDTKTMKIDYRNCTEEFKIADIDFGTDYCVWFDDPL